MGANAGTEELGTSCRKISLGAISSSFFVWIAQETQRININYGTHNGENGVLCRGNNELKRNEKPNCASRVKFGN